MNIVELLLDNTVEDIKLLTKYDELGDKFSNLRDVDFVFKTNDRKQAEIVMDFINDNNYGKASIEKADETHRVIVVINMPVIQNIITPISGFMACISKIFGVEYDGWGSKISK